MESEMEGDEAPFIRLGEDSDSAPRLNYSIPEAVAHVGTSAITIDIDQELLNEETLEMIRENLSAKEPKRTDPTVPGLRLDNVAFLNRSDTVATVSDPSALSEIYKAFPSSFIYKPREGMLGFDGSFDIIKPRPRPPERIFPKIIFFEKIQISSFLGNYGAGRVLKTFSLFPGEKTKISVRNYKKTVQKDKTTVNAGSSILDSVTDEAAVDFENSVQSERSSKVTESEADILNSTSSHESAEGGGDVKVLWGLVEAGGRGATSSSSQETGEWGTRSAREEMTNNVSSALFKHSARASSKRDVEINTSSSSTSASTDVQETEEVIEREIENVNVSRTLNLVFRQMVQEFISVIHLTDVKIALYDESTGPYPQFSIYELEKFLDAYIVDDDDARRTVLEGIVRELFFIFDYRDQPQQFLEQAELAFPAPTIALGDIEIELPESLSYLRVNRSLKGTLEDHEFISVQGVILKENVITMRTEGVVVDGFLGQGGDAEAGLLDTYSAGLQAETVRDMQLRNALQEQEQRKQEIATQVVADGDEDRARIFRTIFCCPKNMCCGADARPDEPPHAPPGDGDDA